MLDLRPTSQSSRVTDQHDYTLRPAPIISVERIMTHRKQSMGPKVVKQPSSNVDAGFDRWLSRQLHKMYDDVLNEDIPQELIDLVKNHPAEPSRNEDAPRKVSPSPPEDAQKRDAVKSGFPPDKKSS